MKVSIGSTVLNGWTVVDKIGTGSFGDVYKIERKHLYGNKTQYAALKVINIPKSYSEKIELFNQGIDLESVFHILEGRFQNIVQEVEMMDPLKGHGNIVAYEDHEIWHEENELSWTILIRMELLTPLVNYARYGQLSKEKTMRLGIELCQALEACEKKNIIHRDIKPQNIFVNEFGSFKLGDFGIARTIDGTTEGTSVGTYHYMAPEVFFKKPYNKTVDIYSLGIVLYQYFNRGRLPFMPPPTKTVVPGDMERSVSERMSGKNVPPIEGIDTELNRILEKACAYKAEERYQTASEFKEALVRYKGSGYLENTVEEKFVVAFADNEEAQTQKVDYLADSDMTSAEASVTNQISIHQKSDDAGKKEKKMMSDGKGLYKIRKHLDSIFAKADVKKRKKAFSKKNQKSKSVNFYKCVRIIGFVACGVAAMLGIGIFCKLYFNTLSVDAGDLISFGHYEQDNDLTNGGEPIEWEVLSVNDDQALIVSRYGLEVKAYHNSNQSVTWETSDIRAWLNGTFYDDAFTKKEKNSIVQTQLTNSDNEKYGVAGGTDTNDYVFLLSYDDLVGFYDVKDNYSNVRELRLEPTPYAKANGANGGTGGNCRWWLRSPGNNSNNACCVYDTGWVDRLGKRVDLYTYVVRPAVWVSLDDLKADKLNDTETDAKENKATETTMPEDSEALTAIEEKIPEEVVLTENTIPEDVSEKESAEESVLIKSTPVKRGDTIILGRYEQDNVNSNGAEPIEWEVLDVMEDGSAVVISKYALDGRPYNDSDQNVTWADCSLRSWLNSVFYNKAFTSDEQNAIFEVCLENPDNEEYHTEGGEDTIDKVFILAIGELEFYYRLKDLQKDQKNLITMPTEYAKANGVFKAANGACWWWVRTPGTSSNKVVNVRGYGGIFHTEVDVSDRTIAIRPAIILDTTKLSEDSIQ